MLVPFVIDKDAFKPDPDWTSAQQRACYNGLLSIWERIGLLSHDGDSFSGSQLQNVIQSLPPSVRPQWQEMLERAPLLSAPRWDGRVANTNLMSFADTAKLAFVDDEYAEVEFGFNVNCDEALCGGEGVDVAVCRILAAGQAKAFRDAITITGAHVEAGDSYQTIWDTRFDMLARAPIKRISIVDRYGVGQHMAHPQSDLSGLERFLRLLNAAATGSRHLKLYSGWTAELSGVNRKTIDDICQEIDQVLRRLPNRKISRVKVYMVPNTIFRDGAHDRFIRFEDYVWDIGLGLEILDGAYAAKRSSASFKTGLAVAGYKRVEQDLAANADAGVREIR